MVLSQVVKKEYHSQPYQSIKTCYFDFNMKCNKVTGLFHRR